MDDKTQGKAQALRTRKKTGKHSSSKPTNGAHSRPTQAELAYQSETLARLNVLYDQALHYGRGDITDALRKVLDYVGGGI